MNHIPDLGSLNYPCYLVPIMPYIEKELNLFGNTILAYQLPTTQYLWFDCIPNQDFIKKKCKLTYEERLKLLRHTLTEVADFSKHIDIPWKVSNPVELREFYKDALTNDCKGVKIYDVNGYFTFGEENDKYWELVPKEVVIE